MPYDLIPLLLIAVWIAVSGVVSFPLVASAQRLRNERRTKGRPS